jgi:hypothetical protein
VLKASKHEAGSKMSNHYDPSEMMTLIGFSCKQSNLLRREVLIDQDSFRGGRRFEHRNNLLLEILFT